MALAKLLKMHRRTDFEKVMYFWSRYIRPEVYKTRQAKANALLARLIGMNTILSQHGIKPYF